MQQLIFNLRSLNAASLPDSGADAKVAFRWFRKPVEVVPACWIWWRIIGTTGVARLAARLAKGKRQAVLAMVKGRPAGFAYVTRGFCRYYKIQAGDAVVGPVFVRENCRGCGLGVRIVNDALRVLARQGVETAWIDTSEDNAAMLKVIERCGFEGPVAVYERELSR